MTWTSVIFWMTQEYIYIYISTWIQIVRVVQQVFNNSRMTQSSYYFIVCSFIINRNFQYDLMVWTQVQRFFEWRVSQENFHRDALSRSSPALPELTYAVKLLPYSTVNHSQLPICPTTTTPEQQMNKFRLPTPFPMAQLQWKTLASTNNLSSSIQSN